MTVSHRGRTCIVHSKQDLIALVFTLQQLERLAA
jgi:hypothetical protein